MVVGEYTVDNEDCSPGYIQTDDTIVDRGTGPHTDLIVERGLDGVDYPYVRSDGFARSA